MIPQGDLPYLPDEQTKMKLLPYWFLFGRCTRKNSNDAGKEDNIFLTHCTLDPTRRGLDDMRLHKIHRKARWWSN